MKAGYMKAVVKARQEAGATEIREVPIPKIKPNEALVQIKACGVCGSDLGLYEWRGPDRFRRGIPIELPRIIGHEASGVITEVGSAVPAFLGLKPGLRIATDSWSGCGDCQYCRAGDFNMCERRQNIGSLVDGAMADYCAIPYFNLYPIPDSLSFDDAALLEPLGVGIRANETLVRFVPGNDVAVLGCGAIGLLEAAVAKARGAAKVFVIGLGIDKPRLEIAKKLGFITINADEKPAKDVIMEMTNKQGVDVVFDATSNGAPKLAVPLLKRMGQLVITAVVEDEVIFNGKDLRAREIIITTHHGRNPPNWYQGMALITSGRVDVKPIITHRFKIQDTVEAFETLKRREGLKALIIP